MQCIYLVAAIIALCAEKSFSHVAEHLDSESCSLTCGTGSDRKDEVLNLLKLRAQDGEPGQRGERGRKGDVGDSGLRGQKGETGPSCQCAFESAEREEMKSMINVLKAQDCPQTRYVLPRLGQITDYIRILVPIPELKNATICTWIKPYTTNGTAYGAVFSYAVGVVDDQLLFTIYGNSHIVIVLNRKFRYYTKNILYSGREYHICFTFSRPAGFANLYVDGKLENGYNFKGREPLQADGAFVLGQDQDSEMSGFQESQCYHGEIRNFMMWDRILTEEERSPSRSSSCNCVKDHIIALTPDTIQLIGAAAALPVEKCVWEL